MSTWIKIFVTGMLLFLPVIIVHADTENNTLNHLLQNIHTMQADFTQQVLDGKGKQLHQSQGTMALQRPGKFRWNTLLPNKQLVVATGTRLWIYDVDLQQVIVRALAKQAGETPASLLSDANPALETDFIVKQEKKSSAVTQYVLTPKGQDNVFETLKMGFHGDQLIEMQLRDHLGQKTIIKFKNIKLNTALADSLFKFSPPKNVDIIDETKQ